MIDRSDLRTARTDLVMVGAVAVAFALGGFAVSLDALGPFAAGGAVALAGGVVWYLDVQSRIPEVNHADAADALRDAADELDRLDELTREALRDAIDVAELDVEIDEDAVESIEDVETLRDLAERSGLDDDLVAPSNGEDDADESSDEVAADTEPVADSSETEPETADDRAADDEDDRLSELGLDLDDEAVEHVDDDTLSDFLDLLKENPEREDGALANGGESA